MSLKAVPSEVIVVVDIIVEPLSESWLVGTGAFGVACGIFPLTVVPSITVVDVDIPVVEVKLTNADDVDIVVEPRSNSSTDAVDAAMP